MIPIDDAYVDAAAPNADAAKNGRRLVLKNKLTDLHTSDDGDLIFGACAGSGKDPYRVSADFARPDQPTYRCSCPSRQLPCKHVLGLMYAYAQQKPFPAGPVPDDLAAKREKLAARVEKKATEAAALPKQVNAAALAKKVKAQLDGVAVLETLTHDLVRLGIGNMNAKLAGEMARQADRLGDAYLPGARAALYRYLQLFADESGRFVEGKQKMSAAATERTHTEALDQLARLHATIKQGRVYLTKRLEDPGLAVPTDTPIAAWLGHAWQLGELKACGRVEADAELVQLAFNSHDDPARKEFIDTGVWMTLGNGTIRVTQTLRPYKAAKFIKSEDSFFQVARVKELCVYPGGVNPRVRWDGMVPRPLEPKDLATIRGHGQYDFAAAVKEVKNTLKGPLADKTPILALNFARVGKVGDALVAEDAKGERLVLTDVGMAEEPPSCHLLPLLPKSALAGQTLIARFRHDLDARKLQVKPLSIVTPETVIRLTL
ncbi:MAG: SWIM zinc finger domain-containing protein [Gemmataceae bacterium]|nr:SWIM zinc finger domain-containing protein [Gemmataceae bacterium]